MNKIIFLVFYDIFGIMCLYAQGNSSEALNAAGGYKVVGGNTYEWSVGEPSLVATYTTASLIVSQGVLQPAPFSSLDIKQQTPDAALRVFPNPTRDCLQLEGSIPPGCILQYDLCEISGRKIRNKSTLVQDLLHESIDMSGFSVGTYFLKIRYTCLGITFEKTIQVQKIY